MKRSQVRNIDVARWTDGEVGMKAGEDGRGNALITHPN